VNTTNRLKNSLIKFSDAVNSGSKVVVDGLRYGARTTMVNASWFANSTKRYVNCERYEFDLDFVIKVLHIHNPKSAPPFVSWSEDSDRVAKKTKYIAQQALLFIKLSATTGMALGGKFYGPDGAVAGYIVGAAAGVVIVVLICGAVVIYRSQNNSESLPVIVQ